jgi:protein TonB
VRLLVDADGSVARAVVTSDPTGMFARAAVRVARLYRFRPAKVSGRAVATEIDFTIHFELD